MGSDYTFNRSSEIINTNNLNYRKLYKLISTVENACSVGDLVMVYTSGNNMIPAVVISNDPFTVSSFNPLNLIDVGKTDIENPISTLNMYIGSQEYQVLSKENGMIIIVEKTNSWNSLTFCKNEYGLSDISSSDAVFLDIDDNEYYGYQNISQGYWVDYEKIWYPDIKTLNSAGYKLKEED